MKAATLAAAVAAALAIPSADAAIRLNPHGTGDALYVPYYTVEDGQNTLLTVSNNTDVPKAVRLNFIEALNGQRVLTFNVYLAPRDSWNAALLADGDDGPARIVSADDSCTVPAIADAGQPFVNFAYAANYDDGGPAGLERTRTGSIEIIEMGVVGDNFAEAVATRECGELIDATLPGGAWEDDPNAGFAAPTGGLSASVDIVDVAQGLSFSLSAEAIAGFALRPHHTSGADEFPRISHPVAAAEGDEFDVLLPDGRAVVVDGELGPDAISALFMVGSLLGDVHLEDEIGASTSWLVAFPTRHAYVFDVPGSLVGDDGAAVAPFTQAFNPEGPCDSALPASFDMAGAPSDFIFSPPLVTELCAQAQLVTVELPDAEPPQPWLPVHAETGRAELRFRRDAPLVLGSGDSAVALYGLPAVGYRLSHFVNAQAQAGVLANYTVTVPLESTPPAADDGEG